MSLGEKEIYETAARAENQAADMAVRVLISMACFIIIDLTSNIFTIYIPYFLVYLNEWNWVLHIIWLSLTNERGSI